MTIRIKPYVYVNTRTVKVHLMILATIVLTNHWKVTVKIRFRYVNMRRVKIFIRKRVKIYIMILATIVVTNHWKVTVKIRFSYVNMSRMKMFIRKRVKMYIMIYA